MQDRLVQSQAWDAKNKFTLHDLNKMLIDKIHQTDFNNAKRDILPFIKDKHAIDIWSKNFFLEVVQQIVLQQK